jgi:hypothetical protein
MLRRARDLESQSPGTVAFINFEANFDQPVILKPTKMDRSTWQRSLAVALDDLAALVAPSLTAAGNTTKTFMCETLASLVTPQTETFKELQRDIFGAKA